MQWLPEIYMQRKQKQNWKENNNISIANGILKRYVVRLDCYYSFKDDVWRSDMGRLFQSFGPTCENLLRLPPGVSNSW